MTQNRHLPPCFSFCLTLSQWCHHALDLNKFGEHAVMIININDFYFNPDPASNNRTPTVDPWSSVWWTASQPFTAPASGQVAASVCVCVYVCMWAFIRNIKRTLHLHILSRCWKMSPKEQNPILFFDFYQAPVFIPMLLLLCVNSVHLSSAKDMLSFFIVSVVPHGKVAPDLPTTTLAVTPSLSLCVLCILITRLSCRAFDLNVTPPFAWIFITE